MRKYNNRIKLIEENIPASENYTFDDAMKEVLSEATKEELRIVVKHSLKGDPITDSESKMMQEVLIERTEIKLKQKRVVDKCQKQNMRH